MAQQMEPPPAGVEVMPEDVQEELNRIELQAQNKFIEKIMNDPAFGQRFLDDPESVLRDESLADELGYVDEVEGHRLQKTKWRFKCYYSAYRFWSHYRGRGHHISAWSGFCF